MILPKFNLTKFKTLFSEIWLKCKK